MVGLPDTSIRESRDRIRSAIRNSGFEFPPHRITVNLAPADVRKAGASFDLPIALGILAASGIVERRLIADFVLLGELTLDGSIHATRGVLPIAVAARRDGLSGLRCGGWGGGRRRGETRGRAPAAPAGSFGGFRAPPAPAGPQTPRAVSPPPPPASPAAPAPPAYPALPAHPAPDLSDVRGQLL